MSLDVARIIPSARNTTFKTMATTPRIGKFLQTPLQWSNGTNFNGFLLIAFVPSTGAGGTYTEVDFGHADPAEKFPQFAVVPIQEGLYNSSLGLYYNEDMSPPGSTYIARYYDTTKRLIAGPTVAFSVTSDPITTIPSVTLTVPTSGGTAPTPD